MNARNAHATICLCNDVCPAGDYSTDQRMDTPVYHMAGWFDIFLDGTLRNFSGIQEQGRSKATRKAQKLIIGPWTHGPIHNEAFARYVGDLDFGPSAFVDFNGELLRWYDCWLNDVATGVLDEARVRYFVMGANEWRTADRWPPTGTTPQRWYLRNQVSSRNLVSGRTASLNEGALSLEKPVGKEKPDRYQYDPLHPVPTLGGNTLYGGPRKPGAGEEAPDFSITAGPRDQRPAEPMCLTYTSEVLAADLDVIGLVTLTLFASSDCPDTDFVAKLCDVFPDGRSILVVDGILRARYRKSRFRQKLLKSGQVYRFEIDLWPTAWRFAAGHRLRVAVTSSNYPRFDRNLNTGKAATVPQKPKVATNTVYHERRYPSHLTLPVMETEAVALASPSC